MYGEAKRRDVRGEVSYGRLGIGAAPVVPEVGIGKRTGMAEREPVMETRASDPVQLVGREVSTEVVAAVVGKPQLAGCQASPTEFRTPRA